MKKHGIAKFGQLIGNLCAGHIHDFVREREPAAQWQLKDEDPWIMTNVNIVDVISGTLKDEDVLLIQNKRIVLLGHSKDLTTIAQAYNVTHVVDAKQNYLIPGLSDIHCHLSLISEYKLPINAFYYFDAQRELNCENALKNGCTFVRDSGGAYDMIHGLDVEIKENRLLGPKIFPSYQLMTSKKGMWDVGKFKMKMGDAIFGGEFGYVAKNQKDVDAFIDKMIALDSKSIKFYLEERPLYGGRKDDVFNMFTEDMVKYIVERSHKEGKVAETHAMFINGARQAIRSGVNSIAHMTVDKPYSPEDAALMVENNVAIVPTTTLGTYLAMNFVDAMSQQNDEFDFFTKMLQSYTRNTMDEEVFEPLKKSYLDFYDFISRPMISRKMPMVGTVFPDRIHGFHKNAPISFRNFLDNGTKIGMGTDGGTGTSFCGNMIIEFETYKRYGMSEAEVLRSATITNMEILGIDKELGSLDVGKYADMVLLSSNPLKNIHAIQDILKVYKDGRCYIDNTLSPM